MNTKLIELFNAAIPEKTSRSFASINAEAIQRGYIVEPDACTESVYNFLRSIDINPNATFYKKWEDITSKTRFELLIDQLFHYMSTYGTDFSMGNGYVPNDGDINIQDSFTSFKVIKAISKEELYDKCFKMISSGIALKQETMEVICDYIISYAEDNKINVNVDAIANREALIYICKALNIAPTDKFNLFRYIIYVTTGSTMIIKNREMIDKIKMSCDQFDFSTLNEKQLQGLASIFLRYKDLFLAFKHQGYCGSKTNNAPIINKLRKMAIKFHEPMTPSFWNEIFSKERPLIEISTHLSELTPYKKVALMQTCMERSNELEDQMYIVRNQKSFIRKGYKPSKVSTNYLYDLYALLKMALIQDVRKNAFNTVEVKDPETDEVKTELVPKTVKLSKFLTVTMPTSEKNFIGNYPFGTSCDMSQGNTIIGIYWKNEWGTYDFDLSYGSITGQKIGWNREYYTNDYSIVFSGDMTSANPEATELLYMQRASANAAGIVHVNQYRGNIPSKYRLFVAQENINGVPTRNYMVNPSSIKLNVEVDVESKQIDNALVANNKITLMSIRNGNAIVSRHNEYSEPMIKNLLRKSECFIEAEGILREAGFNIVDENYEGNVDIDMANLDKDSLIAIMAAK